MLENNKYTHGVFIRSSDKDFEDGINAAVDYRGDVTLELKDGRVVEGFLYNAFRGQLDLFPKNSPQKQSVSIEDLQSVQFSGADEAAGKSWEDWVKRRENKSPTTNEA